MIDYSGSRATPRLDLAAALMEFIDQAQDYIGTMIFPIFRAPLKKGTYSAITRETLTQIADTKRATRGNYNRGSVGAKDKNYACEENGFEMPLGDDERKLYSRDFDAEMVSVKAAMGIVMRNQESRIATLLLNTSVFTGASLYTDVSGSNAWSDAAKDIILTVRNAKQKVRANCGLEPNAIVMSQTNIDRCKANGGIKDAIKYTARATDQELMNALADLFGVKYVLNGRSIKNSAKEGQSFSSSDLWSPTYVSLAVISEDGQDLSLPTIGRTFLWTEDCPENALVEQYRDEAIRSDIFRTRQHTDEVLIDPYFGHLLKVV